MAKVTGRFYFKRTTNGNLLGEFSNDQGPDVSTESCDVVGTTTCFVGNYQSSWREKLTTPSADLEITQPKSAKLFSLEWREKGILIFKGEGMLCDNILVGDYQSHP